MDTNGPCELQEVIIISLESPITDKERERKWKRINNKYLQENNEFSCPDCVWGVQDMEKGIPTYCYCFYGQQHLKPIIPWYVRIGDLIIKTFRNYFKN